MEAHMKLKIASAMCFWNKRVVCDCQKKQNNDYHIVTRGQWAGMYIWTSDNWQWILINYVEFICVSVCLSVRVSITHHIRKYGTQLCLTFSRKIQKLNEECVIHNNGTELRQRKLPAYTHNYLWSVCWWVQQHSINLFGNMELRNILCGFAVNVCASLW